MGAATQRMAAMREETEFLAAAAAVQEEADAAKEAYRQALLDGVPSEIETTKQRHRTAAQALIDFRQWARETSAAAEAGEGSATVPAPTVRARAKANRVGG